MKKFFIICMAIISFEAIASCQKIFFDEFDSLQIETTTDFIKKTSNISGNISSYAVFVIRELECDSINGTYCFVISYIHNSFEYNFISPTHFSKCGNDIVVFSATSNLFLNQFMSFHPVPINSENERIILSKLMSEKEGFITGHPKSVKFCKNSKNIIVRYNMFNSIDEGIETIYTRLPIGNTYKIE
jgi:hypothetical protein